MLIQEKIIEKLKDLMRENDFNQKQLIYYLKTHGITASQSTIHSWLTNEKMPTKKDNFEKLCKLLSISLDDYNFKFNDVEKKRFPLLGSVACGEPIWADEDKSCFVMADSNIQADFCLIVKGDSMLPLVHDGDIVFIKKQDSVLNGEIAVVIIDNEATLKRFYQDGDKITLVSINPNFAPIVILASENKSIRICGRAVFYQSLLK